jgi:hypothetical protein
MAVSGIDKERMNLFWRVACSSSLEVHESAHALFAKAVGHELVRRLDSAGVIPQTYVNDMQVWVLQQLGSSLDPSMILKIDPASPEC